MIYHISSSDASEMCYTMDQGLASHVRSYDLSYPFSGSADCPAVGERGWVLEMGAEEYVVKYKKALYIWPKHV